MHSIRSHADERKLYPLTRFLQDQYCKWRPTCQPHFFEDSYCASWKRRQSKDEVRKDTQAASFNAIRILLTLAALPKFHIASLDIKGAYLQSGPCKRYVFVRTPNEWPGARGIVWKLLKLPHGLPDAGHQWQVVIDDFHFVLDFTIIPGIPQLFLHLNVSNNIDSFVAKVINDILIGAWSSVTAWFVLKFKSQFDVGRVVVNENMHLNGSFISVSADGYTLDIAEPLSRIQPISLDDVRRTSPLLPASAAEIKSIRSLAGSLNFIGQAACPPATFIESAIQQRLGTEITV
jgi:hypothetical protein